MATHRSTKPTGRPSSSVLWGIAGVVLALVVGLAGWVWRANTPTASELRLAQQIGFDRPTDMRRLFELMEQKPGPRFSEGDWRILERTAQLGQKAAGSVGLVISRIDREEDAARAIPIANVMRQLHPKELVIQDLPDLWRKRCPRAAAELDRQWGRNLLPPAKERD